MILSLNNLIGYKIRSKENEIGSVSDFLIDEQSLRIRYFRMDAGPLLSERPVLISPEMFGQPDGETRTFNISLTIEEIESHPSLREGEQREASRSPDIRWKVWNPSDNSPEIPVYEKPAEPQLPPDGKGEGDESRGGLDGLRYVTELIGNTIHAKDGETGVVDDLILASDHWMINYLVVRAGQGLPGKRVIVAVSVILTIGVSPSLGKNGKIHLSLTKEAIIESPEFDPAAPVNRESAGVLYDYRGRRVGTRA